jgi:hypothetical protein
VSAILEYKIRLLAGNLLHKLLLAGVSLPIKTHPALAAPWRNAVCGFALPGDSVNWSTRFNELVRNPELEPGSLEAVEPEIQEKVLNYQGFCSFLN